MINDTFKVAQKENKGRTIVRVTDVEFGGEKVVIMAGPCSVESCEQIFAIAKEVKEKGARVLRGGAFKPRTSPYDFQGLGEQGLLWMREAADVYGLLVVTEVLDVGDVTLVSRYADIVQIGSRNMHNFALLREVGKCGKAVLLKRGMAATYKEWLLAAEYILKEGNSRVILCERGIRTFETYTRNTLDLTAVAAMKELTHLPIVVDPSHGTGRRELVCAMSSAAVAAGAGGLLIVVHTDPEKSVSDKEQTISTSEFGLLMERLRRVAEAVGRGV